MVSFARLPDQNTGCAKTLDAEASWRTCPNEEDLLCACGLAEPEIDSNTPDSLAGRGLSLEVMVSFARLPDQDIGCANTLPGCRSISGNAF